MSAETSDTLLSLTLREFLDRAGDRTPTPGGSSVAAVAGALATATAQMAARYTIGNARYAEHEPAVRAWLDELGRTRDAFASLMAEDMAAYERYKRAAADRSGSAEAVQEQAAALRVATAVPMEIASLAATVARRMDEMKARCNRHLLSDLAVGAILAEATASAAAANAQENLARLSDRADAERLGGELASILEHVRARRESVCAFARAAAESG